MSTRSKSASTPAETLTEGQKKALLTLLWDEDPNVYGAVREKILALGDSAQPWLRSESLSPIPTQRRRILEILDCLDRRRFDDEFLAFCLNSGEDLCLETGVWLMAQTRYPKINPLGYSAILDDLAGEIQPFLQHDDTPEQQLQRINQCLFGSFRLRGNEKNYYEQENSYLNQVIDRRTGNPISLSIVYILIARRLKLPIVGIGMPGHFLCRHQSSFGEIFIDAFNEGRLLSKAECVRYLLQTPHGYQEPYLAPITPRRILLRICSNLHQIYHRSDAESETERFQRYIVALAN